MSTVYNWPENRASVKTERRKGDFRLGIISGIRENATGRRSHGHDRRLSVLARRATFNLVVRTQLGTCTKGRLRTYTFGLKNLHSCRDEQLPCVILWATVPLFVTGELCFLLPAF